MSEQNEKLGVVIFSEGVEARPFEKVLEAAKSAGIEEGYVRAVRPRSGFIRAMAGLQKDGILEEQPSDGILRDKFEDGTTAISFQFSVKWLEDQGVRYEKRAVIRFDKETEALRADDPKIENLARELFSTALSVLKVSDIQNIVKRIIAAKCKQILLRDGVYFVPINAYSVVEQVRVFFEALDFTWFVLPVGTSGDQLQHKNIIKSTVADMVKTVERLRNDVAKLRADQDGGTLTKRQAKHRIGDLQRDLRHYRDLATSLKVDLRTILEEAGDAGVILQSVGDVPLDALIAEVQGQGAAFDPLVSNLIQDAGELDFDSIARALPAAVPRIENEVDMPLDVMV